MHLLRYTFAFLLAFVCVSNARAELYWVATTGNDTTGVGSVSQPWATLDYALNVGIGANGGHTVRVRPGLYDDSTILYRGFDEEVVVQAEVPHRAVLTNLAGQSTIFAVYVQGDANVCIEGFVITGEDAAGPECSVRSVNMVHFENASNVRFENNIVFGNNREPFCNDLMKINRSSAPWYPRGIKIKGNVFYNHPQLFGNDLIDSVRPGEIEITDNIFFSDLGVSAGQNFITLKREVTGAEVPPDASPIRYRVCRNIFLNWEGDPGQAMLNFGEDGVPTHELTNALVENNLFIGNSSNLQDAPFQFKGVKGITVRSNTIVGNFPTTAFGFLIGTTGSNPMVEDVEILNNVFSDPTGTMGSTFCLTFGSVDLPSITLDNNMFWNDGNQLPSSGGVLPTADINRVEDDPLLEPDQQNIVLPKWDTTLQQFESGNVTIREEFERLVLAYGALPEGSPAIGAADPANVPVDDILGWTRDGAPDLGAFERPPVTSSPAALSLFSMSQNAPNPFNGTSRFDFVLPTEADVFVALYDVRGRRVRTLMDERLGAGRHDVILDARGLSAGTYYYRLTAGDREETRRCVVLR